MPRNKQKINIAPKGLFTRSYKHCACEFLGFLPITTSVVTRVYRNLIQSTGSSANILGNSVGLTKSLTRSGIPSLNTGANNSYFQTFFFPTGEALGQAQFSKKGSSSDTTPQALDVPTPGATPTLYAITTAIPNHSQYYTYSTSDSRSLGGVTSRITSDLFTGLDCLFAWSVTGMHPILRVANDQYQFPHWYSPNTCYVTAFTVSAIEVTCDVWELRPQLTTALPSHAVSKHSSYSLPALTQTPSVLNTNHTALYYSEHHRLETNIPLNSQGFPSLGVVIENEFGFGSSVFNQAEVRDRVKNIINFRQQAQNLLTSYNTPTYHTTTSTIAPATCYVFDNSFSFATALGSPTVPNNSVFYTESNVLGANSRGNLPVVMGGTVGQSIVKLIPSYYPAENTPVSLNTSISYSATQLILRISGATALIANGDLEAQVVFKNVKEAIGATPAQLETVNSFYVIKILRVATGSVGGGWTPPQQSPFQTGTNFLKLGGADRLFLFGGGGFANNPRLRGTQIPSSSAQPIDLILQVEYYNSNDPYNLKQSFGIFIGNTSTRSTETKTIYRPCADTTTALNLVNGTTRPHLSSSLFTGYHQPLVCINAGANNGTINTLRRNVVGTEYAELGINQNFTFAQVQTHASAIVLSKYGVVY
jgi:hypothetical protein